MDSRYGGFPLLTIGAWIVGSAMVMAGASCIPGTVSGTNTPDGGAPTINIVALACSQTPSGCLCVSRDGQPGDLNDCNSTSVATHTGEQGGCCGNADVCTCDAFACEADTTLGFCQCGLTAELPAVIAGAATGACPTPGAGQKCCMAMDTRACICSASDCDSGAMMVPNCTVALVQTCPADQKSATSCK